MKTKIMEKYDVLVIGSGPGGSSVAKGCVKAGKSVGVIDKLFGGTCALKGCTPKKAMESITSHYWQSLDFVGKGVETPLPPIDWNTLQAHKSRFTATVPAKTKKNFEDQGIDVIEGEASFLDDHVLIVNGKEYSATNIVIATGATPIPLDFDGAEYLTTTDDFFELDELPKKVAIVGGGYNGFELSHIMAACGSEVTILSDEEMPLQKFETELVGKLIQATFHKGIEVKLGYKVVNIKSQNDQFKISCERTSDEQFEMNADLVIHAAGRVANTSGLKIENTSLNLNENRGIKVNRFLQAQDCDHIFALGDVNATLPFTEVANYEAKIVLNNILEKRRKSVDYTGVPVVVYTYPKMAMVGLKTSECGKIDVREASLRTSFIQRAHANDYAGYKTIVEKETGKIIGAHMIGYNADEAINIFALAMQTGVTSKQLNDVFLAYPTAIHDTKFLV